MSFTLLLLFAILAAGDKSLPAEPVGIKESEWNPPSDLHDVQKSINLVRILLANTGHLATQILLDLDYQIYEKYIKIYESYMEEAGILVTNTTDLLKALKIGAREILPSVSSLQLAGVQSQLNMLSMLATSVRGLFTAIGQILRDFGTFDIFAQGLNAIDERLTTVVNYIASIREISIQE